MAISERKLDSRNEFFLQFVLRQTESSAGAFARCRQATVVSLYRVGILYILFPLIFTVPTNVLYKVIGPNKVCVTHKCSNLL